ncbi:heat shock protein 90 alpha family class A member 1 [Homo sapiens]|uniref:Heat shock protein 90 alpha family class A member 1 n=1 Tax=Homo sapiens TaxID=9606 RepID=G3V592_HUMAN|nr:heat shock protein 90 alpha family class A member 1 [Homo sapiens]KAI4062474.1 heat shock protein 90 alpha family class A member 1 [Homo sapiens]
MPPCSGGDGSTPPGPSLRDRDCPAQSAEYPRDRLDPRPGSPSEASSPPFLRRCLRKPRPKTNRWRRRRLRRSPFRQKLPS